MIRRPPRSTRTDTLFPYTTLFRSPRLAAFAAACDVVTLEFENVPVDTLRFLSGHVAVRPGAAALEVAQDRLAEKRRSEERRVGKECVSTCRSRWSPDP